MDNWPPKYTIRESPRAKHARLSISMSKGLEVIIPKRFKKKHIPKFLLDNKNWITKHLANLPQPKKPTLPNQIALTAINETWRIADIKHSNLHKWLRRKGQKHLIPWLDELSQKINLPYNKATIRGQKTKWGSCSRQNNINLNYKLLFLESELVGYIIIHELCHTKYLNHSKEFWQLVAKFIPHHRDLRKQLLKYRGEFFYAE